MHEATRKSELSSGSRSFKFRRIWSDLVGFGEPSGFALHAPLLSYQELYSMLNHYQLHMWHASWILQCAEATELPLVTNKLHISEKMLRSISGSNSFNKIDTSYVQTVFGKWMLAGIKTNRVGIYYQYSMTLHIYRSTVLSLPVNVCSFPWSRNFGLYP